MLKKIAVLLIFIIGPFPAFGQTLEEVQSLFDEGEFGKAAEAGRTLGTLKGLTISIQAQLVMVQYIIDPGERLAALGKAIKDSDRAEKINPEDVEVLVGRGILIGLRGRYERNIGDGKESERLFMKALEVDPKQSWALGAMGSWHAETIAEAGSVAGRLVFGAKRKLAWDYFKRSLEEEPDNLAIRAAYVRALLKVKPKKNKDAILENFDYVLNAEPKNALERLMKEQVRQIREAWYAGEREKLKLLLDEAVPLEMAPKE